MTNLISSQSGHWYGHKDGAWSPCHEVAYADPAKGMRKTTLTDARKLQLVPSVTGITGVINAPAINNYRVDQAIKSALTLPRGAELGDTYIQRCINELGMQAHDGLAVAFWCYRNPPRPLLNADEFAKLVVVDAEAHSESAKKLGSEIHDVISRYLTARVHPLHYMPDPSIDLALPACAWINENVTEIHAVEKIVGSLEHGYAGTLDLDCELKGIGPAILDWKSQNVKRNGTGPKPEFYLSYGKQLAAYANASMETKTERFPALVSGIIDKANKGEVFIKVWDNPRELWAEFLNNCATWRFENRYDPRISS